MDDQVAEVRIENLEKEVEKLNGKYDDFAVEQASIGQKVSCVLESMDEVKESVKALQQIPARRWDIVIGSVVSALVAVFAGYIFGKFF